MTFSLSGTIITQTGTDTNLAGLSAIAGVITTTVGSRVYYDLGTLQLVIEGTLSHNPDLECIITKVAGALESIKVEGTYNFGVETIVSGKSRMSSGVGIVAQAGDTGSTPEFNVAYSALKIDTPAGVFVGRGGVILSDRVICTNGTGTTIDVVGTVFTKIGTTARRELRFENVVATDTISGKFLGVVDGFQVSHRLLPPIFSPILANGEIVQLSNGPNLTELSDIDISNNIASNTDLGVDDLGTGAKFYDLVGCSNGSAIRCMPKSGVGDARQLGGLLLKKAVSFNFTDDSASPIQNVKLYCIDTDNGYRKNANGQDHTADKVYQYTSDVSGDMAAFEIITAITNINSESSGWAYSNWDTTAFTNRYKVDRRGLDDTTDDRFTFYFMSYSHRLSQVTLSCKGLGELKTDWVLLGDSLITETNKTTVDAYLLVNTSQQVYDRFKSYLYDNFAGEAETLLSRAGNVLTLGANNLVIDATAAAVVAYSEGTPDTFTIKSSTFTGGVTTTGTVTLQNGALLSGGAFDCDIITADNGVTYTNITATKIIHTTASTATITLDGSTVTEIEVTGGGALTANLVNGASIPTATETSGTITYVQEVSIALTAILNGSRYQIYNVTQDVELAIGVVSGGSGISVDVDLQSANVQAGDTLEARISYYDVVGGNVYNDLAIPFTITVNGFSSAQAQTVNSVLSGIHAQGSAFQGNNVTGFILDVANIEIDSALTSIDGQKLATWLAYQIASTDSGLRNYFDSIDVINAQNFRFKKSIEVDNTGVPAIWTGAAWTRTDGNTIVSASSNTIQFDNALISYSVNVDSVESKVDLILEDTGTTIPAQISGLPSNVLAATVEGSYSLAESMRLQNSIMLGKVSGARTGTETFRDIADTKDRVVAEVDEDGNRTAITLDAS